MATRREQSLAEEIANSVSHGAGLLAALIGGPFLIATTARHGSAWNVVGTAVFVGTIVLLYLASTLYHALPYSNGKRVFRAVDHGAIFLLIAGTYTPFTLGVLRGPWGWTLLGLVWSLAAGGIVLMAAGGIGHPRLSAGIYLGMGWLVLVAVHPLWVRVPMAGLIWLLAGGIAYTAGVGLYAAKRMRYGHLAWHLCVLAGTACHVIAVLAYAA